MSSILEDIQDDRPFKALTGLSREEFEELLPTSFTESDREHLLEVYEAREAKRNRKPGGGQKGKLNLQSVGGFGLLRDSKIR